MKFALAVGVAVAAGVGGLAWYVLDDDAPPPPSLAAAVADTGDGADEGADATAVTSTDGIDGAWAVAQAEGTFVGYRVDEVLAGFNRTAVGRTPAVTGTLVVSGTTVTEATFTADLTALESDDSRRDNRLRTLGLQTDTFPEATFALAEPVALAGEPAVGEPFSVTVTGDLALHGVTQRVSLALDAQLQDDGTAIVVGTLPIVFADYEIDKPDVAGFVTTEDNGTLELQLTLTPA